MCWYCAPLNALGPLTSWYAGTADPLVMPIHMKLTLSSSVLSFERP